MHFTQRMAKLALALSTLVLSPIGCELPSAKQASSALDALPDPRPKAMQEPSRQRIIAIGDLHGDLSAAVQALELAGAIDREQRWIGGDMIVVQTGDEIDRGDDDRAIIDLFERLRIAAQEAGGQVHPLIGNHETLNALGDFRYVTEGAFEDFSTHFPLETAPIAGMPARAQARAHSFLPGGRYAKILASRPAMLVLSNNVFVHGGISRAHVARGIDTMNKEAAGWLAGTGQRPDFIRDRAGPLWMRDYSKGSPTSESCRELSDVLSELGAKRMVVGHSIQEQGINGACDGRVWRIDIGMSAYYKTGKIQVLEIMGDQVRVLSADRR